MGEEHDVSIVSSVSAWFAARFCALTSTSELLSRAGFSRTCNSSPTITPPDDFGRIKTQYGTIRHVVGSLLVNASFYVTQSLLQLALACHELGARRWELDDGNAAWLQHVASQNRVLGAGEHRKTA